MTKSIYLAGPINGLTYQECSEWREKLQAEFEQAGFMVNNPMRNKTFLSGEKKMSRVGYRAPTATPHDIFYRDKFDVMHSDILFVNFIGSKEASIGTAFELAWAHLLGKYVVTVMEKDNTHTHGFVLEASSVIFETVSEAKQYVLEAFGECSNRNGLQQDSLNSKALFETQDLKQF